MNQNIRRHPCKLELYNFLTDKGCLVSEFNSYLIKRIEAEFDAEQVYKTGTAHHWFY